jgi:hypothetical protein
MQSLLLGAALALVMAGGALAQPVASVATAPSIDAKPFLQSMIRLKQAADTCDPYVNNGPAQRVSGIDAFFASLHQALPANMVDEKTRASLDRFIKQQAASICKVMLDKDFETYEKQAALYESSKPKQWPDAPKLQPAPWCATPNCLDIN